MGDSSSTTTLTLLFNRNTVSFAGGAGTAASGSAALGAAAGVAVSNALANDQAFAIEVARVLKSGKTDTDDRDKNLPKRKSRESLRERKFREAFELASDLANLAEQGLVAASSLASGKDISVGSVISTGISDSAVASTLSSLTGSDGDRKIIKAGSADAKKFVTALVSDIKRGAQELLGDAAELGKEVFDTVSNFVKEFSDATGTEFARQVESQTLGVSGESGAGASFGSVEGSADGFGQAANALGSLANDFKDAAIDLDTVARANDAGQGVNPAFNLAQAQNVAGQLAEKFPQLTDVTSFFKGPQLEQFVKLRFGRV